MSPPSSPSLSAAAAAASARNNTADDGNEEEDTSPLLDLLKKYPDLCHKEVLRRLDPADPPCSRRWDCRRLAGRRGGIGGWRLSWLRRAMIVECAIIFHGISEEWRPQPPH